MESLRKPWILGSILIFFLPAAAYADAGLPMIFLSYPSMIVLLLPVILIETAVFTKMIHAPYKKSFIPNGIANLVSTLAGFPLAWGFLFLLEMITTNFSCGPGFDSIQNSIITVIEEAAWLCPWDNQYYWLIPAAFIISLIVAFFISIVIEYYVLKRFYRELENKILRKAVLFSNIASYGMLIILSIGFLAFSIINK